MESPYLIDTHAHLDMVAKEQGELSQIVERAKKEGVIKIITVGIDIDTSKRALEISKTFDAVYAAVGIHPNDAKDFSKSALETLFELSKDEKVCAWGEIGLDYYRDKTPKKIQIEAFESQLDGALMSGLPVIIHAREALDDCISIISNFVNKEPLRGVFHCFSGDKSHAKKVLDLGFYISFTGVVTFPKADGVRLTASYVPLDRMLLETDCPFLSPVPFRGKRNEPSRVTYVAEAISKVKSVTIDEVSRCTSENAKALFRL